MRRRCAARCRRAGTKGLCFICAKKDCYVAICPSRCPSCLNQLFPGAFSSKTCVVYAATEPIAANITNARGRVVSVQCFSYLLDKWTARQAHRPRAHDQAAANKSEQHAAADEPERRFATVAAAEPNGALDEPEQRVAIAAAVPAEPGSALVEPEHHAAVNEPPPPWTALTVPNSRTRRLAHARALARAAVAAASRANTDASASRVARAPNAHARRGFFDAQDEADEQRRIQDGNEAQENELLRIPAVNFFEAHEDGQLRIQAENKAQDEAQENELLRVQVQDAAAERARAAAEARCDNEPERRVANAAAAKPGGAPLEPEQHAAANKPEQRVAITIAAEPGSVLVEPEQHIAADSSRRLWSRSRGPGELSLRDVD